MKHLPPKSVVLRASTGYGKSRGVVREARDIIGCVAARVVHVLSLHAIVEQVYYWAVEELGAETSA